MFFYVSRWSAVYYNPPQIESSLQEYLQEIDSSAGENSPPVSCNFQFRGDTFCRKFSPRMKKTKLGAACEVSRALTLDTYKLKGAMSSRTQDFVIPPNEKRAFQSSIGC